MKNSTLLYILVSCIGLLCMYLLYVREDYCVFSSCRNLVPSVDTTQTLSIPKSTPNTNKELSNGD